jgi:hypothetical protein
VSPREKMKVRLYDLAEPMLVVECPSGVVYMNQVGGNVCWWPELEGVLAPLGMDSEPQEKLAHLPYPNGREGISVEIADAVDELLASARGTQFIRVDRSRLSECWEAWIYVVLDTPVTGECRVEEATTQAGCSYYGEVFGFGAARGVLTWPNSD